jgi:5-methyltetrahydropteroyltriglutamate--homocysteine methyltransferase
MSIRPDGRPPFRADHVGSLLRPPALRQAFRQHAAGSLGDEEFHRIEIASAMPSVCRRR